MPIAQKCERWIRLVSYKGHHNLSAISVKQMVMRINLVDKTNPQIAHNFGNGTIARWLSSKRTSNQPKTILTGLITIIIIIRAAGGQALCGIANSCMNPMLASVEALRVLVA